MAFLEKLPQDAVVCSVVSSFPSICATLQHLYQWDSYYFTHMRGGKIGVGESAAPQTYAELKVEVPKLHDSILRWAQQNLAERKDDVLYGWAAWPMWQIVMQMANHTTHHLGQILTLARQAGYEPSQEDWTDLILYHLHRFPTEQAIAKQEDSGVVSRAE
jgi:uncharacterized damage-inducible protein DinB